MTILFCHTPPCFWMSLSPAALYPQDVKTHHVSRITVANPFVFLSLVNTFVTLYSICRPSGVRRVHYLCIQDSSLASAGTPRVLGYKELRFITLWTSWVGGREGDGSWLGLRRLRPPRARLSAMSIRRASPPPVDMEPLSCFAFLLLCLFLAYTQSSTFLRKTLA